MDASTPIELKPGDLYTLEVSGKVQTVALDGFESYTKDARTVNLVRFWDHVTSCVQKMTTTEFAELVSAQESAQ